MAKKRSSKNDGIVRIPVLPTKGVEVGPIDRYKTAMARRMRTAGFGDVRSGYGNPGSLEQFGSGLLPELLTGAEDFAGLSLLLKPPSERYGLYRHFWRTNPFVGRAIDIISQLPMSKIRFSMPKGPDKKLNRQVLLSYKRWAKRVKLYFVLVGGQLEKKLIGDAWLFCEWSDEKKEWSSITVLPPESVKPTACQFSDKMVVEFKPNQNDVELIKKYDEGGSEALEEEEKRRIEHIPRDIRKAILEDKKIYLGTNPYEGSFVYQASNNKEPYVSSGVSVVERIIASLITQERFRNTQLGLAGRNMTPKHIVSAETLNMEDLETLREEIDISFLNPEYPIVVNFPIDYQLVGAQERLLDLETENQSLENQYMAGLGVTRELIIGEGIFSGNKITVEVINQMFGEDREQWKDFVEEHLMKPMSKKRGLVQYIKEEFDLSVLDRRGAKEAGVKPPNKFTEVVEDILIPAFDFSRITIRDNQEVFDSLMQLYQKGSLPIDYILELFNIDSEDAHEKLVNDLFTVKDATFNDMIRDLYSQLSELIVAYGGNGMAKRIVDGLGVKSTKPKSPAEGEEGEGFGGGRFGAFDEDSVFSSVSGKNGTNGRNGRSRERTRR